MAADATAEQNSQQSGGDAHHHVTSKNQYAPVVTGRAGDGDSEKPPPPLPQTAPPPSVFKSPELQTQVEQHFDFLRQEVTPESNNVTPTGHDDVTSSRAAAARLGGDATPASSRSLAPTEHRTSVRGSVAMFEAGGECIRFMDRSDMSTSIPTNHT